MQLQISDAEIKELIRSVMAEMFSSATPVGKMDAPKPKKPKKARGVLRECPHCGDSFKQQGYGPHVSACARKHDASES